jgi:hypothetical protein
MAEIHALVAHEVFNLTRDELPYVLDPDNLLGEGSGVETFKALRNRENGEFGEYRTHRLVLEAWQPNPGRGPLSDAEILFKESGPPLRKEGGFSVYVSNILKHSLEILGLPISGFPGYVENLCSLPHIQDYRIF